MNLGRSLWNGHGLKLNLNNVKKLVFITSFSFLTTLCLAQPSIMKAFIGDWEGNGILYNQDASFTMKWESVLNEQFFRLNFKNRLNSGAFQMHAYGYYKLKADSSITGHWFDSRGVSFSLVGHITENSLTINWGTPETEQGRTEYILTSLNGIKVSDFILRNNEYSLFGEATYQQKKY